MLPPDAMLKRLTSRLPLLTGGARDLPERQRTLGGTIGWSYELLAPDEQALFRRLSVFAGGATLEAIEAVAASDELGLDVFDGLERLVDQSLLRQAEVAGAPRFAMLETIREYGLGQLETAGEAQEAHLRHAAYFCELATHAEPKLTGPEQQQWLAQLESEHDNLRAALRWTLDDEPGTALRIAASLWRFWYVRGYFTEGRVHLKQVLVTDTAAPTRQRAMALHGASVLASVQYDLNQTRILATESLECYQIIGNQRGVAHALNTLGDVESMSDDGNLDRAAELYNQALAWYRQEGHQRGIAVVLTNLGIWPAIGEKGIAQQRSMTRR
jgi:non-specific serine/threonine protein kinase